jgi:glycosyltransferase involved in cell wall biosynthesis
MISVLILTFNEEANIGDCIASLPWRSDVCVLDSGSSDRTPAIATEMGGRVVTCPFTNYAEQRNFGLALPGQYDWIVSLDADERMTPELAHEIEGCIGCAGDDIAMFRVRRKDMFMGRWLRRSSGYPTWFPRVFRRGRVRVEREINEVYAADGTAQELEGHILHFPFNKGLEWWFERHNYYSTMEARVLTVERSSSPPSLGGLLARDPSRRRSAIKALAYRLPARPFLIFIYLYLVRLGFLDGTAGYHYASMRLAYEFMIDAKMAQNRFELCGHAALIPHDSPLTASSADARYRRQN